MGTIAATKPLKGYPMFDTIPVADSVFNATSTGDVKFFMQKSNPIFANLKKKNEVSATFSNQTETFDSETSTTESTGYKVMIIGYVAQVS